MRKIIFFGCFLLFRCVDHHPAATPTCTPDHPVRWKNDVQAIVITRCATHFCHSAENPALLHLSTIADVQSSQFDVRTRVAGGSMPVGTPLSDKEKFLITCWIDQGAKDN